VIEIHGNAKSRGTGGKDLGLPALPAADTHEAFRVPTQEASLFFYLWVQ